MDAERALLSKIISTTSGLPLMIEEGVREDHFGDPQAQEIWAWMNEYYLNYNSQPPAATVRERFPHYHFEPTSEVLPAIRDRFITQMKYRMARQHLEDMATLIQDPEQVDKIEEIMFEYAREISDNIPSPAKIGSFKAMPERIKEYDIRKLNGVHRGILMGIEEFDDLTDGIQPHEYVSIVGWQGTGKSTLAQYMMYRAWCQGKKGLYFSLEMGREALFRKWDTMHIAQMRYRDLKKHDLDDATRAAWEKEATALAAQSADMIVLDDVRSCSVEKIFTAIGKHTPDLVVIDYITLMDLAGTMSRNAPHWEKVTYLTQALKGVAQSLKVPIIGVAQTNIDSAKEGARLENVSYARSIGADSDLVIGLHQDETMKQNHRMTVRLLKNRDGSTSEVEIEWHMDTMQFGKLSAWQKLGSSAPEGDDRPAAAVQEGVA